MSTDLRSPPSPDVGPSQPDPVRRRRGPRRWILLVAVLALLIPTLDSYGRALTGPGNDPLGIRSVEWLRSHHFRWAVNDVENFWYTHHAPKKGGAPSPALQAQLQGAPSRSGTRPSAASTGPAAAGPGHASHPGGTPSTRVPAHPTLAALPAPAPIRPFVTHALPGEGDWRPLGQPVHGVPAMYVTYLRPDAVYTSLVASVAWIDPDLVRAVGYAGALEPGGSGWAHQLPIAAAARPQLLAAFNSGFKMDDAQGGYYDSGRYERPLRNGAATLWITKDGRAHVGEWGRDVSMNPDIVLARQNLDLIVDGGQPVPGVSRNDAAKWGFTVGNKVQVWRSGIGVAANGALIYAAGPGLSASMLADLLTRAGAVRAMELDINSDWVDFFTYTPGPTGSAAGYLQVNKLLVDMAPSTSNYLTASSRDCIALFSR